MNLIQSVIKIPELDKKFITYNKVRSSNLNGAYTL